jgi:hypothetical protein
MQAAGYERRSEIWSHIGPEWQFSQDFWLFGAIFIRKRRCGA